MAAMHVQTTEQFAQAFGGPKALAEAVTVSPEAVYKDAYRLMRNGWDNLQ